MKEYVFLNYVFTDSVSKNITLAQVLCKKEFSYEVTTKVVTIEELRDIYLKSLEDKNLEVDFIFDGDYLRCDTVPNIESSIEKLSMIRNISVVTKPAILSVYHLFEDLVSTQAYLIEQDKETKEIKGISSFQPNYSETTMTVYIPIKIEDKWISKKLIYIKDGKLVGGNFTFMMNKKYKDAISKKYGIAGEIQEDNVIFNYNGELPIYAFRQENFQLPVAMVNRSVYESTRYKYIITLLQIISNSLVKDSEPTEQPSQKGTEYISGYTMDYVQLRLNCKIKRNRIFAILQDYLEIYEKLNNGEITNEEAAITIHKHSKNVLERNLYYVANDIMSKGGNDAMDRLDYTLKVLALAKIRKFKIDTYLYMCVRAPLFVTPYKLKWNTYEVLKGGNTPFNVTIERKKGGN